MKVNTCRLFGRFLAIYILQILRMLSMLYCKQTYTMHGHTWISLQTTPKISQEQRRPQEARFGSVSGAAVAVSTAALLVSQARKEQLWELGDDGNFPILNGDTTGIIQNMFFTHIHHFRA